MKIVHTSIYPPKGEKHSNAGGVASYTKNLITSIPYSETDEVYILCNKIRDFEEYSEDGIRVIRCFNRNPKFFLQILLWIYKLKPDVIHVQQEAHLYGNIVTAYLLQWLLLLISGNKIIVTLHGIASIKNITKKFIRENNSKLPVWLTKFGFYAIFKPLCIWSDTIIVHEQFFRDILVEEYGASSEKIKVIYHGVENLKRGGQDSARKLLNVSHKQNICLYMGYLTGYKGIDLLIEGFAEYTKRDPNAFLFIGAGKHPKLKNDPSYLTEYTRVESKAKELIPSERFRWVGFIPESEISLYYSASNVLLLPYTTAMSASGPLSFAIGFEQPFLVSDAFDKVFKESNIIFRQHPEALADKLEEFFKGQRLAQEVKKMKDERLWGVIASQTYQLYITTEHEN